MRKRVQIALAVLLGAILGVLVWQIFRFREPVYQGKRLSVWLEQYGTNHWSAGQSGDLDKQAEIAIRQIGTNAIPLYLGMMTTTEWPLKIKLMAHIPRQLLAGFYTRSVYEYRILCADGLIALGEEAKSAVPALINLLNHRDPDLRYPAVFALRSLGPVASDALPSVIAHLKDADFSVQSDAILGLGEIHQDPQRVIPILVEFLSKPQNPQHSAVIRDSAIWSLRQFGAQAKPALPTLLRLLNDADTHFRSEVTNTLLVIDREAAARAGVRINQ